MTTVVAAVIRRNGTILACRRRDDQDQPGKWEFPGGKLEPGETPPDALRRELLEELGVQASALQTFARVPHSDGGWVHSDGLEALGAKEFDVHSAAAAEVQGSDADPVWTPRVPTEAELNDLLLRIGRATALVPRMALSIGDHRLADPLANEGNKSTRSL